MFFFLFKIIILKLQDFIMNTVNMNGDAGTFCIHVNLFFFYSGVSGLLARSEKVWHCVRRNYDATAVFVILLTDQCHRICLSLYSDWHNYFPNLQKHTAGCTEDI